MKLSLTLLLTFLTLPFLSNSQNFWPQKITTSYKLEITLYQPIPELLDGKKLSVRSAVSIKKIGLEEVTTGCHLKCKY